MIESVLQNCQALQDLFDDNHCELSSTFRESFWNPLF